VIGVLPKGDSVASMSPLGDRVLIQIPPADDKSSGGVLLNVESAEKPTFGKVGTAGPWQLASMAWWSAAPLLRLNCAQAHHRHGACAEVDTAFPARARFTWPARCHVMPPHA
jgi:hypothetical protein